MAVNTSDTRINALFSSGDFPELDMLLSLIERGGDALRSEVVCEIDNHGERLPVHCIELGNRDPEVPVIGFFGGIHGVERIGTQVLLAFLHSLVERLPWDESLAHTLSRARLVFMPLVNPGGMRNRTRCNPAGVDLMRNAPVEADGKVPFMLGGQRWSPRLPWYRGDAGQPMQAEAAAVCKAVEERLLGHRFALSIDCHSGFGLRDRIWFPYARSREPVSCLADIYALRTLFRDTHPHHSIYTIEPQSLQYTTHGDLWDHLYDTAAQDEERLFLPLTLEMGSWLWVKKSPAQMFNLLGMYNPMAPHRHQRTLRRHLLFFDFMIRAAMSHARWRPTGSRRTALTEIANDYWYRTPAAKQQTV
jgi:hypothetical protein